MNLWSLTMQMKHCVGCAAALAACFAILIGVIVFGFMGLNLAGSPHEHTRQGTHDITFCVSPDGNLMLFNGAGKGGMDLYVLNLRSQSVRCVAATPEYEMAAAFSPDGKSIVYAAGPPDDRADHLYMRDLSTNVTTQITTGQDNDCSPEFMPDGKRILFARDTHYNWGGLAASWSGGGALWMINRDGTGLRRVLPQTPFVLDPRVSSDGKRLLWCDTDGLYTARVDGTASPQKIGAPPAREAALSPATGQIAYTAGQYSPDQQVYVIPAGGGQAKSIATAPGHGCFHPAFSPDGKTVYYLVETWNESVSSSTYGLWQVDTDGTNPHMIANHTLFEHPLEWRPN